MFICRQRRWPRGGARGEGEGDKYWRILSEAEVDMTIPDCSKRGARREWGCRMEVEVASCGRHYRQRRRVRGGVEMGGGGSGA